MKVYSSAQNQSFYVEGVHKHIPSDAVEISGELYETLLDRRSGGMDIDFTTLPPSVRDKPVIELTVEERTLRERLWRDAEFSTTEWLVTRHREEQDMQIATTLTIEQLIELLVYRQALRDWPQSEPFPDFTHRPIEPLWLPTQSQ